MLKKVIFLLAISQLTIYSGYSIATEKVIDQAAAPDDASSNKLITELVKAETVKKYLYLDGVVEAVQQATLFSQTSGRVIKLNYDVGDVVEKGSIIAQLRDTEQKARFDQTAAGLAAAKAQYEEAELEYNRVIDLFQKQLLAAAAKDKAEAGLKSANALLSAARARHDEAKEQLAHTVIRAPYGGKVTERHIDLGETLQVGKPVITGVAQQDALRFNVQIPQRLIAVVRKLSTVEIILDAGDRITSDQITVFPTADKQTHSFQLRAQVFSNQHRLYPGMYVKVAIETGLEEQILLPRQSIVHRGELSAVYVLADDNTLYLRQLRLGQREQESVVVLAGLSIGEKIVLQPDLAAASLKAQRQGDK